MAAADPWAALDSVDGLAARALVLAAPATPPAVWAERLAADPHRLIHADDGGPAAASLALTLETGHGCDICLAILWLEHLRRQGSAAEAVDFPGRMLVRLTGLQRSILDPCQQGRALAPPELRMLASGFGGVPLVPGQFGALDDDQVLLRLQGEAKIRLLRTGDVQGALNAVEGALRVDPDQAKLWRESGLMRLRLGDLPGAVAALEQFVIRTDNGQARGRASQLLAQIRVRLP
jgi:regulator of sirC expression with transglutaminase-like and TPR domain